MIQVSADGMTTLRITCSRDAPRMRTLLTRFPSTSRTPWKALKNTTKNTRNAARTIFDVMPSPSMITKSAPSTIRGSALTALI
jgi:hypothetical protein